MLKVFSTHAVQGALIALIAPFEAVAWRSGRRRL